MLRQTDRLAIFLPSLAGGGAERVAITLANGFVERGEAVDLLVGKAEGPYGKDIDERVRVIDLASVRISHSLPGLVRYLRGEKPIAMLSVMSEANVVACCARLLAGGQTRLVLTEHNSLSQELAAGGIRSFVLKAAIRLTYPIGQYIVAVSQGAAEDVEGVIGIGRGSVHTIYNPVVSAPGRIAERPEREAIPLILAAGRLVPPKDYPTLLRAFASLRQERVARLVILGEGELRAELESLCRVLEIADDVEMPGFSDALSDWMARADLFVLSSAWEGFGNVLVEAMAAGTQVVSTDCTSGPAEILENGRWGRLVPVGDDAALASAMTAALDEIDPPDVVSRAADFSIARALDSYLELLKGKPHASK